MNSISWPYLGWSMHFIHRVNRILGGEMDKFNRPVQTCFRNIKFRFYCQGKKLFFELNGFQ
jgi:hypothetical protein